MVMWVTVRAFTGQESVETVAQFLEAGFERIRVSSRFCTAFYTSIKQGNLKWTAPMATEPGLLSNPMYKEKGLGRIRPREAQPYDPRAASTQTAQRSYHPTSYAEPMQATPLHRVWVGAKCRGRLEQYGQYPHFQSYTSNAQEWRSRPRGQSPLVESRRDNNGSYTPDLRPELYSMTTPAQAFEESIHHAAPGYVPHYIPPYPYQMFGPGERR